MKSNKNDPDSKKPMFLSLEEQNGIPDEAIASTSGFVKLSLHSILKEIKFQLNLLHFNGNFWTIAEIQSVIATRKVENLN